MGSVLKDATRRSSREMLQLERAHTDIDLSESFASRFAEPLGEVHAGVSVAIDRLGRSTHGDFWFLHARADGDHFACLGRIEAPPSFESTVQASAAATLLERALAGGSSPADTLVDGASLFAIHCCTLLHWRAGEQTRPAVYRLTPSGNVEQDRLDMGTNHTTVLTTLDEELDRRAARYARSHAFESPMQCVKELQRFLGDGSAGGVLAVQTFTPGGRA
jgi:hypothetical protein